MTTATPIVLSQGPTKKMSFNKLFIATRISKVKLSNFMQFEDEEFSFGPTNFITAGRSCGKSTIIIGIFLALGQDHILFQYGRLMKDVIKLGTEIAVITLTVATPHTSELRDTYGSTIQITRKIQMQNGILLPNVWKVRSLQTDHSRNILKTWTEMNDIIFPQLSISHLNGGVPFLVTPQILELHVGTGAGNPWSFWYEEFDRFLLTKMNLEVKMKSHLDAELEELLTLTEDQQPESRDSVTEYEIIQKLFLQIQIKRQEMKVVGAKLKLERKKCESAFVESYKRFCEAVDVFGACIIDCATKAIMFAVDDRHQFGSESVDSLEQRYTISSLRNKKIATCILILTFWKVFDVSPIYIIQSSPELKRFLCSNAFDDMIGDKPRSQFFITGYAF